VPNGWKDMYGGTKEYMNFSNLERQHSSNGKSTPAEKYYG